MKAVPIVVRVPEWDDTAAQTVWTLQDRSEGDPEQDPVMYDRCSPGGQPYACTWFPTAGKADIKAHSGEGRHKSSRSSRVGCRVRVFTRELKFRRAYTQT